ncbi:hypothetical protein [Salinigranum marinum]|uniref:hypothetical protein n=1 Tax=Salinigranum marinum TaxID=1515595 RepID=UPI002989EECE|nr:hypothetical protein [Salinigranum marinum]
MLPSTLRRPAYTGENRCWPCTVVNAAVVLVAAGLLGVVSIPLGAVALVCGFALVALRGYVVPYTPAFAPRLVAKLPVDLGFDHPPRADGGRESESLTGDHEVDGDALVRRLAEAGVVTADESGDLFLADGIRRRWGAGMDRLRTVSAGELAAATASAAPFPADGRVEGDGDWVVVTRTAETGDDGSPDGEAGDEVWLSRAHAIADTAVVAAVGDRVDALTAARAATPLRLFLETCPVCGGTVEETTVKACCGGTAGVYDNPETPVLACADCGEPLYEF